MKSQLTALVLVAATVSPAFAAKEYDAKKLKMSTQMAVERAIAGNTVKSVDVGGHTFHFHDVSVYMRKGQFVARGILRHSRFGKNAQVAYEIKYRNGMKEPKSMFKFHENKLWQKAAKITTLGDGGVGDWKSVASHVVANIGTALEFKYLEKYEE